MNYTIYPYTCHQLQQIYEEDRTFTGFQGLFIKLESNQPEHFSDLLYNEGKLLLNKQKDMPIK